MSKRDCWKNVDLNYLMHFNCLPWEPWKNCCFWLHSICCFFFDKSSSFSPFCSITDELYLWSEVHDTFSFASSILFIEGSITNYVKNSNTYLWSNLQRVKNYGNQNKDYMKLNCNRKNLEMIIWNWNWS